MVKTNKTLLGILSIFLVPLVIAALLFTYGYTGQLQNKGSWISPPFQLSAILKEAPQTKSYQWTIIFPCKEDCQDTKLYQAGVSTLGTKSDLVSIIALESDMMKDNKLIDFEHAYVSDPQQLIVLKYNKDNPMDIVFDLKKLLKPIEKRS